MFNLRDLSRIYEGMYLSTLDKVKTKGQVVRMWRNECMRVFADKLINHSDRGIVVDEMLPNLVKTYFKDCQEEVMQNPILFGDFKLVDPEDADGESNVLRLYEDLIDYPSVKTKMDTILEAYNFNNREMGLVLFDDALEHITKIHRILRFDKGSALLVGFGGSGKQSLTRLATYLAQYEMFQITLKRGYKEEDFREELKSLYGVVLQKPRTFMFTDAHVVNEGFLELINNILTIGMVPALFPEEEKDGLKMQVDEEIRKRKLPETKEFAWEYFVNKARSNLHIVLCMSPAGESLRVRCRNFPGLITNTTIDWFFPWPREALMDVATVKLGSIDLTEDQRLSVCNHIVLCHQSVQDYSKEFEAKYKRKNYSTPKNYLDFIKNYITFLDDNRRRMTNSVVRLEGGLSTLEKAAEDTKVLGDELQIKSADIAEKKEKVEIIIAEVNAKTEDANKQ
jgi:dynein heavy chain, axonemal